MYQYKLLSEAHIRDMQREAREIHLSKMVEKANTRRVRPSINAVVHFLLMVMGR
jgi:hypothetical protein